MQIADKKPYHIGIVIPAHNEQDTIADCLNAVQYAIANLPNSIQTSVLVVLDSCSDNTQQIVKEMGVDYLTCDYRCVGKVRDLGVRHLIAQGADWIACTDADSQVDKNWLVAQLGHINHHKLGNFPKSRFLNFPFVVSLSNHNGKSNPSTSSGRTDFPFAYLPYYQHPTNCDMICGVVSIENWQHLTTTTKQQYLAHYQDQMGHRHIHGANLSFSATSFLQVGGFADLPCHEDVDLVKKFEQAGLNIIWSNKVRVTTSSRLDARAKEGFAGFLQNLENQNSRVN